jgi:hypothetical protein
MKNDYIVLGLVVVGGCFYLAGTFTKKSPPEEPDTMASEDSWTSSREAREFETPGLNNDKLQLDSTPSFASEEPDSRHIHQRQRQLFFDTEGKDLKVAVSDLKVREAEWVERIEHLSLAIRLEGRDPRQDRVYRIWQNTVAQLHRDQQLLVERSKDAYLAYLKARLSADQKVENAYQRSLQRGLGEAERLRIQYQGKDLPSRPEREEQPTTWDARQAEEKQPEHSSVNEGRTFNKTSSGRVSYHSEPTVPHGSGQFREDYQHRSEAPFPIDSGMELRERAPDSIDKQSEPFEVAEQESHLTDSPSPLDGENLNNPAVDEVEPGNDNRMGKSPSCRTIPPGAPGWEPMVKNPYFDPTTAYITFWHKGFAYLGPDDPRDSFDRKRYWVAKAELRGLEQKYGPRSKWPRP